MTVVDKYAGWFSEAVPRYPGLIGLFGTAAGVNYARHTHRIGETAADRASYK